MSQLGIELPTELSAAHEAAQLCVTYLRHIFFHLNLPGSLSEAKLLFDWKRYDGLIMGDAIVSDLRSMRDRQKLVDAVRPELDAVSEGVAVLGDIAESNAHRAAIRLYRSVLQSIVHDVDPSGVKYHEGTISLLDILENIDGVRLGIELHGPFTSADAEIVRARIDREASNAARRRLESSHVIQTRYNAGEAKRRGRRKADNATEQRNAKILAEWRQARDAGWCKKDWLREHGEEYGINSLKELTRVLNTAARRLKRRKTRSDN